MSKPKNWKHIAKFREELWALGDAATELSDIDVVTSLFEYAAHIVKLERNASVTVDDFMAVARRAYELTD